VADGETWTFDDQSFTLRHSGPGESDDDSLWTTDIDGTPTVFSGDLVYHATHSFFRDGHTREWLSALDRWLLEFDQATVFHGGHGDSFGLAALHWQRGYINAFVDLLGRMLDGRVTLPPAEQQLLIERMHSYAPTDDLAFLAGWQFDDMVLALRANGVLLPAGQSTRERQEALR
jgi:glyoxylase-like metal-dependent hydrolase (beta-lactamase superfamily II)